MRDRPSIQEATPDLVAEVGANMREADRRECLFMSGLTGEDAARVSVRTSDYAMAVSYRGRAAMLFGFARPSAMAPTVTLWALGTPVADANPRWVVVLSRACLYRIWTAAGTGVECGSNLVWTGNAASRNWLGWLGASFGHPVMAGPFCEEFIPFTIERG